MTRASKPQLWFLTGSQALYGEETLEQVAGQSLRIQQLLAAAGGLPAEIVGKPVLTEASSIRRVLQEANADAACVGVIAWMHTFSPAKMWITGLDALRKPLLHLHTQLNEALPWSTIDMDFMNLNQAAHGDREFGFIQTRLGVPRKTVAGHVSDPAVVARIDAWARAAIGADHLRNLRLARFGDNMRDVAVTEGDKVEAELRFGVSVNTYVRDEFVHAQPALDERDQREGDPAAPAVRRRCRDLREDPLGQVRHRGSLADQHQAPEPDRVVLPGPAGRAAREVPVHHRFRQRTRFTVDPGRER